MGDGWPSDLASWAAGESDFDGASAVAKKVAGGGTGYAAIEPIRSPVKYMGTYRHQSPAMLSELPAHKIYVEPFAGPGDFFLGRRKAEKEIVNDKDERLIRIWRFLKGASDRDFRRLKAMNWTLTKGRFGDVKASTPTTDLGWFYKVAFMTQHALMAQPVMRSPTFSAGSPNFSALGKTLDWKTRLEDIRERLQGVTILNEDYRKIFDRYGSRKDALFFIDPPYPSTVQYYKEASVDFADLGRRTKNLAGKWVVLYEATKEWLVFKGSGVERTRLQRSKRSGIIWSKDPERRKQQEANYNPNGRFCYIISNVPGYGRRVVGKITKSATEISAETLTKSLCAGDVRKASGASSEVVPIWKADEEQRIVFGEVLVPEDRDLQGDIYSAEAIAEAAHKYLSEFRRGKLGEQHDRRLRDEVDLYESYVAPVDMTINGRRIKKGTWLMMWKIHSDRLWGKIKRREITGFSIGGSARKRPG